MRAYSVFLTNKYGCDEEGTSRNFKGVVLADDETAAVIKAKTILGFPRPLYELEVVEIGKVLGDE